uniref:Hemerythrin n=1 Tax=Nephtys incisa TaxID=492768 RepID=A0A1S6QD12_9ANNE|nr:hemerythrin [Nephtys incisa]
MGHDIPEPYCWDESFAVFYAQLDEEHKGLFKGIFECAANRDSTENLSSLAEKVKTHFTNEEAMFTGKVDNEDTHKAAHVAFVEKLGTLSCPLDDATIDYAKDWLVNHIKNTDFTYKGKLD